MSRSRIEQLEAEMDSDSFDMSLFDAYAKEINELQSNINDRNKQFSITREKERQEAMEQALHEKYLAITDEEVDTMYSDFHKLHAGQIDNNGRTFTEWFTQATSLYDITLVSKTYNVTSKAKSDYAVVWDGFVSVAHAKSKVLELIKIKFRDHHNRPDRDGCDFAHIPTN